MIIGDDLRSFANDRDRQRLTRHLSDEIAGAWRRSGTHRRFTRAMAGLRARTAEAVAQAVCATFSDDQWVDELIATLADAVRRDPFLEPPFLHLSSDVHRGLVVFEDANVSIGAGITTLADLAARKSGPRGATSVALSGQVGIFKFARAGGARLSFWEAPAITAEFTADRAGRVRRTCARTIADGEVVVIDGRRQGFVIEHARGNLVILQASVKLDRAPVAVEYDSETGAYVACSAADDSASRIQMISTLLGRLGAENAFPAIAGFLDHPSFFVRWHVMRELLGLDAEAALPHLKRMAARDPHPETRRTARSVLDRIERRVQKKAA